MTNLVKNLHCSLPHDFSNSMEAFIINTFETKGLVKNVILQSSNNLRTSVKTAVSVE